MSSQMGLCFRKKPEWDWPPRSPATELVAALRDLEVADRKLVGKWAEGKEKRKLVDRRWLELRDKEQQLRRSFIHFNKFVKVGCYFFKTLL
jgi:hypothetical protein